jgi:hypothetical protein
MAMAREAAAEVAAAVGPAAVGAVAVGASTPEALPVVVVWKMDGPHGPRRIVPRQVLPTRERDVRSLPAAAEESRKAATVKCPNCADAAEIKLARASTRPLFCST